MQKLFTSIVFLLVLTTAQAQKKTALSLNLEKGKAYKQVTESTSTINQDIQGQQMNIVMLVKGTMSYTVINVTDQYEMDVRYESLSLSMQLPQGSMEFSSEKNDEQDIFSKILAEMKKNSFQIKITKQGKITEVKNIDKLFESAFDRFSDIPQNQMVQIKAQLQKAYGEDAMKGNIEMVTAIYPEHAVSINDTWIVKTKLESGMSAAMTSTYKYAANENAHYLITGDSKIETADKDAYIETNGIPMKYNLKGTMLSEIKVDKKSGWIIEATVKQEMSGDVSIEPSTQIPDGMTIPMSLKTDMKFTN